MPPTPRGIIVRRRLRHHEREHNDDFSQAWELQAGEGRRTLPWPVAGNTLEADEPTPTAVTAYTPTAGEDNAIHQTVWFKVRSGRGLATLHTGSFPGTSDFPYSRSYDEFSAYGGGGFLGLFVAVYTGASLDDLVEVASAVHTTSFNNVQFRAQAGTTYWIQVGTLKQGANGYAYLYFDFPKPPNNDRETSPETIIGSSGSESWNPCRYFIDPDEPVGSCGAPFETAWFEWLAPATDTFTFTVTNTVGDAAITVWDESATVEQGCSNGNPASVALAATEGITYLLQVGMTADGVCGTTHMSWTRGTPTGNFFVSFTCKVNATYASFASNGGVSFLPNLWELDSSVDDFGQGISLVRHRIGAVNQDYYTWGTNFTDNFPDGFRFGPQVVPGTTYTVEAKVEPGGAGVGKITVRIDDDSGAVEYGPWDADSSFLTGPFDRTFFGQFGTVNRLTGVLDLDNFKLGTTDWGANDLLDADFASAIVPPFDSTTDSAGELSVASGQMHVILPGGTATRDAYAVKAL